MKRVRRSLLLCILLLALAGMSPDLRAESPAPAGWEAFVPAGLAALLVEGPCPVWLFFTDKGPGEDDPAALAAAEAHLSERALARRAKVLPAGERLRWQDLPLAESYLAELAARGFAIRAESRWLNAVSVVAGAAELESLRRLPFVARIEPVRPSERRVLPTGPVAPGANKPAPGSPYDETGRHTGSIGERDIIDYGGSLSELTQINVPAVHELDYSGAGVIVGMLDTGFITTHEALEDVNVLGTWDFINDDAIVANEEGDGEGQHNHGTMTLSTVGGWEPGDLVGPAYGASYYLAKTEDTSDEQPIEEDWWVEGIEWLESEGCDVVSSSLAYKDWYVFDDMDGNTAVTTIAADWAVFLGVTVVNSAGNWRQSEWGHIAAPADGDSVIAVGAVEETGEIAGFSSPGPTSDGRIKPDLCARGVSNHVVTPGTADEYQSASGTSFACPLTSGVCALLLEARPSSTPMELLAALRATASQSDSPDNDYGWGIIDALAALNHLVLTTAPETAPHFALAGNWPNPFNPSTRIAFRLATGGDARLAVFDLRGRRVAILHEGTLPAGEHNVVWDGRDGAGRQLASGVYFARLSFARGTAEQKMIMLK